MGLIRAFAALEIPDEQKNTLEHSRGAVERALPPARWVPMCNQHLTLKFFGDIEENEVRKVFDDLKHDDVGKLGVITVALGGGGFFPNPRRPRVAWVGGRTDGIERLVGMLEDAAERRGIEREHRRWSLHLTQARVKKPWAESDVSRFLGWADGLNLGAFECARLVLFRSELKPSGAVYTALEEVVFG